jgi:mono/diheme cytochrome c family protein
MPTVTDNLRQETHCFRVPEPVRPVRVDPLGEQHILIDIILFVMLRQFGNTSFAIACAVLLTLCLKPLSAQAGAGPAAQAALLDKYCVTCHNDKLRTGGLSLEAANLDDVPKNAETWEKVIRKLHVGAMPPQGLPRPDKPALDGLAAYLETSLDRAAVAQPNPGRATMYRLNRAEYANSIRDLLGLDIDATALLPPDDESSGFDNIADVLRVSPSLMERYLSASWNISRLAVGNTTIAPATSTYRVRPDLSQDQHIDGLPLGTRGGMLARHNFPVDGEYIIKVRLWRNTFDLMRGMEDPHQIEMSLDGARLRLVAAGGKEDFVRMAQNPGDFGADLDQRLTVKIPVKAGEHTVSATTILRSEAEKDDLITPFLRTTVDGLDITGDPSVDRVSIEGPFGEKNPGNTASRRKIFVCRPTSEADELSCARNIVSTLAHRAYRHPVTESDLESLLSFYQHGRNKGGFDAGIESALQLILASPEFLFRFEPDPPEVAANAMYRVDDMALASRLSFFLWSTIPDEQLLNLASQGKLKDPAILEQQVKRMLADQRSAALVDNFAEQWLFLRNLKTSAPNLDAFPDFDDNLREAMKEETKLFFSSIMHEDRNIMDLLTADYTFVNERLARHYGIPNVYGSQFRRIKITDENRRGLLGQASILTITSYPNRTSPVQRGKWILTNVLGTPPTPPPPNVPELKDNAENAKPRSLRERMEEHRADAVCAGCHKVMDPIGFSLENFDAIGRWRTADDGAKIDPSGTLFTGARIDGAAALRNMLTARPETFVGVMTEKLLTYALGRGVEYYDMPTVRKIVRDAGSQDYRFSSLIMGIVKSTPFETKIKKSQPGNATIAFKESQ